MNTFETSTAGLAFDRLATTYDSLFTFSVIGRSQRKVVWGRALKAFTRGSHILELNCGTGQDALFLAEAGMTVTACDASLGMIEQARYKMALEAPGATVEFLPLRTEEIDTLPQTLCFDGVFSNFSGLNCVGNLTSVAQQLSERLTSGAPLLLCFSTRYCLWEIAYFLLRGDPRKAFRRWSGMTEACLDGLKFPVYYPSIAQLRSAFAPEFRLVSTTAVGLTVPPSYVDSWVTSRPRLLKLFEAIDETVRTWPGLRALGDHMLLHLERVGP
ncbi:class I SAM-dependent methyltransferase [Tunturibacter empetritectus]|uniref:Class I SAM-dependent methyltransferase n=1 Tax=Tunturiibacter empetritectus TaxID=3069691 RepID=A0AAU7Z842_9BACT